MLPRPMVIVSVFLALSVRMLDAQSAADARWTAQCRDYSGDWQVKHCETRVVTLAKGGTITVDPGENGGVQVEGWSRDSIEVHARIQTLGSRATLRSLPRGPGSAPKGLPPAAGDRGP